jgi:peptidoglycan hydrolase-like protein with peptidoglycan-binding domain
MRRTTHLALMLLMAAGPGVATSSARAQAPAKKKSSSTAPRSGGSSHRGKSSKGSGKSRRRDRGQKAPSPERITEIQQALAKGGSYSSTPSGKWDDATVDAMKRFQEANGLNPSGKLDAKTLQRLGLGSTTSGIAAPAPPANSSVSTNLPPASAVKQP